MREPRVRPTHAHERSNDAMQFWPRAFGVAPSCALTSRGARAGACACAPCPLLVPEGLGLPAQDPTSEPCSAAICWSPSLF